MSGIQGRDPYEDYVIINNELKSFSESFMKKPQIVVANKMDISEAKENLKKFKEKVSVEILETTALNGEGLEKLVYKVADLLDKIPRDTLYDDSKFESHVVYKFKEEKPFTITKENDTWIIKGKELEKLLLMSRFDTNEAIFRFSNKLRKLGIDDELRKLGAEEGDLIKILDFEFEFKD